jgi:UPF0042 nucleotide-binding protein
MEVKMRFVVVTGISGAGKSQAAKYLEDMGFFCVDNLPPSLIPKFAEICFQSKGKMDKVALVIDIRGGVLLNDFFPGLNALKEAGFSYDILFLEASNDVLVKRFKESRRTHPLAADGRLIKGIEQERDILQEIKEKANYIIDTSELTPRQLREEILNIVVDGNDYKGLIINVISFGFKYGIPTDCDLVFDVRFIPNPFYVSSMKKLTGKHEAVKEYVMRHPETQTFLQKLEDMLDFLIPNYVKEGKSHLVIGIGCTGGKHRSVTIADSLYKVLGEQHRVIVEHRDIEKDNRGAGR